MIQHLRRECESKSGLWLAQTSDHVSRTKRHRPRNG